MGDPTPEEYSRATLWQIAMVREAVEPEFTLSNGIVLKTRAVPREIVKRVLAALPEPKPPMYDRGDGTPPESNPLDPAYHDALDQWNYARLDAFHRCLWARGVLVVTVPPDLYPPDSDVWIDELESLDVPDIHRTPPPLRYLDWLHLYAAQSRSDEGRIMAEVSATYGLLEREVLDAMGFFRSDPSWRADLDDALPREGRVNGHSGGTGTPGDSAGVRGEGNSAGPASPVADLGDAPAA